MRILNLAVSVFMAVLRANRFVDRTRLPAMIQVWIVPNESRAKFDEILGETNIVKQAAMILSRHRKLKRKPEPTKQFSLGNES